MIGKYKVTLTRGDHTATHVLVYQDNERPAAVSSDGDAAEFIRPDGSVMDFSAVHMDMLHHDVQHWTGEIGAEGTVEELTEGGISDGG